ncbi:MAG: hypothetical protein KIT09_13065 [Bryobacteraceae bacterium]|nr:hypothetical protein [Bryobacteraceae bacterium]
MADTIVKVDRFSIDVPDQPGEGARVLQALAGAKVNLTAMWGYPQGQGGTARIELVTSDAAGLKAAAKAAKIKLNKEAPAFHIVGRDKVGALASVMAKLAASGVNVHAVQAASTGPKFGCMLEVAAGDVRKAAKALGV